MRFAFFAVPTCGGEVADELDRFLANHRVLRIDRELVAGGAEPHWAVCVVWTAGEAKMGNPPRRRGAVDYRDVLSEEDFALFAKLRGLRKHLAEQAGSGGCPAFRGSPGGRAGGPFRGASQGPFPPRAVPDICHS